ncbi:class F sortase [Blastococcus goldschmidtiae]|uniref:Class F sortase n=1 Tax=Blastococcus goldschmidtiae TaxID=3075546 RepID=A0ABU2KDA7_9ACTN|nr:class F sortase [Blastococcus sp. DSM 46792]MDT0278178.1 class F sortase [Blastococcus sp. DSM 46792]
MRPAAASAVLGLALAVGAPTAWVLTQPEAAAGIPLEQPLPATPSVTTRDAAPSAIPSAPAPVRISVPSQGVDARVDAVGIAADGQMELPEDVSRVGWYRLGPAPGAEGSAVLAGHVDDREQRPGALFPLDDAAVGDEITVPDAAGTATRWRVVSRQLITEQVLPLERIFARDGAPRLTVITCGGPFLPEFRSYRDNVVVVAEPVR